MSEFVFNVPQTTKVIWRWGHGLGSHPTDLRSPGWNSGSLDTRRVVYPQHHRSSSAEAVLDTLMIRCNIYLKYAIMFPLEYPSILSYLGICNIEHNLFFLKIWNFNLNMEMKITRVSVIFYESTFDSNIK